MAYTVKSPLKAWEGEFILPDPDEFNRQMWDDWRKEFDAPRREPYAMFHLYAYSGLVLIEKHGEWKIDGVTLGEVKAWEYAPMEEKTKLVAFIGREIRRYIDRIIDPKG